VNPDDFAIQKAYGEVLLSAGDASAAVAVLEKAFQAVPEHANLAYALARALKACGRIAEAQPLFAFVAESRPQLEQLHHLEKQLRQEPENLELRMKIASVTAKYASRRDAIRWYETLLHVAPDYGPAHAALAAMERTGILRGIITQNVDRLHHAAGSRRVVELHGALAEVRCLACGAREDRGALHARLLSANPAWLDRLVDVAPDGDADLPASAVQRFQMLDCTGCGGTLMPDVVFFGGTVPERKVAAAWALLDEAEALLVVGSSLAVYSGWRFVRGAAERGMPIALVNIGQTRADHISQVRIEAAAGALLPRIAARLRASSEAKT
jgi:NAD-dependent SIR2 family protein deacetylase